MKYHPQFASIIDISGVQKQRLQKVRHSEHQALCDSFELKAQKLARYCNAAGIEALVIGLSGGIDSALTLMLAKRAQAYSSTRLTAMPVFLPTYATGATGQQQAHERARECAARAQVQLVHWDLTAVHAALQQSLMQALSPVVNVSDWMHHNTIGVRENPSASPIQGGAPKALSSWAAGQMVSTVRTPALYGLTSALSDQGIGALVLGTTNYDEGAYIGYIGKASDAMVDVQPLSDWHKSEVYALAALQGVPESILRASPTGDMHDGRTDQQVFGFTYDALEWDLRCRYMSDTQCERFGLVVDEPVRARVQALHQYNAHKYLGASVAVHLDVWARSFEGSWQYNVWTDEHTVQSVHEYKGQSEVM